MTLTSLPSSTESATCGAHRILDGDTDPWGPDVHEVTNPVESFRWVLQELGARGLSAMMRRGSELVFCSRLDEDGYVPPRDERDDNGPATISQVTSEVVVARLALNYLVWKWGGPAKDPVRVETFMPTGLVRNALAAIDEAPNLRVLRGVTHTPMVRDDGSILDAPGYDATTNFLYLPTVEVAPVPTSPTTMEVKAATKLLRGLVDEFVWAGKHDEANYLGLLLTPLLRELCPPPYKLAAIMARQPGSGKSLLARLAREVHGGVFRSEMPHDDAELEKSVTSILTQTTAPIVVFDNVTGILRSSRLAGLLTSRAYSGRVLGSTNNIEMVNDRLWTITGNNLALGGDLVRRTIWVTIDPRVPDPERRTGFRIANLPAYVTAHRGEILHALLVWVRAWIVAGKPQEMRSSDDYAHWSAVVRGILQVAGVPGEFDHEESAQQTVAVGDDDWRDFLEAIDSAVGSSTWSAKELLSKVHDGRELNATWNAARDYEAAHPIPLEAVPAELVEKLSRNHSAGLGGLSRSLGRWLANREGRWAGDLTVRRAGEDRTKLALWKVERFQRGDNVA
ncbi:hypothetical protein [Pseudonocardia sp. TRM90224]|uniref:hypothetical protein n=1 Tax=Pseudonocardia sp. TRM90224 TaxID=2812678 RepID=UPI001E647BF7|nr:hypothetical protein [Pseudonocardia sp. TRM90224]